MPISQHPESETDQTAEELKHLQGAEFVEGSDEIILGDDLDAEQVVELGDVDYSNLVGVVPVDEEMGTELTEGEFFEQLGAGAVAIIDAIGERIGSNLEAEATVLEREPARVLMATFHVDDLQHIMVVPVAGALSATDLVSISHTARSEQLALLAKKRAELMERRTRVGQGIHEQLQTTVIGTTDAGPLTVADHLQGVAYRNNIPLLLQYAHFDEVVYGLPAYNIDKNQMGDYRQLMLKMIMELVEPRKKDPNFITSCIKKLSQMKTEYGTQWTQLFLETLADAEKGLGLSKDHIEAIVAFKAAVDRAIANYVIQIDEVDRQIAEIDELAQRPVELINTIRLNPWADRAWANDQVTFTSFNNEEITFMLDEYYLISQNEPHIPRNTAFSDDEWERRVQAYQELRTSLLACVEQTQRLFEIVQLEQQMSAGLSALSPDHSSNEFELTSEHTAWYNIIKKAAADALARYAGALGVSADDILSSVVSYYDVIDSVDRTDPDSAVFRPNGYMVTQEQVVQAGLVDQIKVVDDQGLDYAASLLTTNKWISFENTTKFQMRATLERALQLPREAQVEVTDAEGATSVKTEPTGNGARVVLMQGVEPEQMIADAKRILGLTSSDEIAAAREILSHLGPILAANEAEQTYINDQIVPLERELGQLYQQRTALEQQIAAAEAKGSAFSKLSLNGLHNKLEKVSDRIDHINGDIKQLSEFGDMIRTTRNAILNLQNQLVKKQ